MLIKTHLKIQVENVAIVPQLPFAPGAAHQANSPQTNITQINNAPVITAPASISFNQNNKIYSIRIQTLQGRVLDLVGNNGLGNHKFSLKLNQQKRAIVGFKGKIGEYIEGLIVYSWKLREKSRK